jgi:hypothetical protein
MIWFILGIIVGIYLGWRYENVVNDIVESIKLKLK